MIDIHTHILPLVDDGAKSFEEAIEMIRTAYRNGTNGIVLTPHCAPCYGFRYEAEEIREKTAYFTEVVCRRERIPVSVYSGMEVLYEGKSRMKQADAYLTINESRYLLLEYMFDIGEKTFLDGIHWVRDCGRIPVVAHPERYECVQENRSLISRGREAGACFQISEGSLFGKYGRMTGYTAQALLETGEVQVIASDAHNLAGRTPFGNRTRIWLEKNYGRRYAKLLLHDNPKKIVQDQELGQRIGDMEIEE